MASKWRVGFPPLPRRLAINLAKDSARVVFKQSYRSNTFSDVVTKTLDLAREGGDWKIVRETARPFGRSR